MGLFCLKNCGVRGKGIWGLFVHICCGVAKQTESIYSHAEALNILTLFCLRTVGLRESMV